MKLKNTQRLLGAFRSISSKDAEDRQKRVFSLEKQLQDVATHLQKAQEQVQKDQNLQHKKNKSNRNTFTLN